MRDGDVLMTNIYMLREKTQCLHGSCQKDAFVMAQIELLDIEHGTLALPTCREHLVRLLEQLIEKGESVEE